MSAFASLRLRIEEMNLAADIAIGLVTSDLRARYAFWRAMGNASPLCERWAYHPNVEMFNCEPDTWRA